MIKFTTGNLLESNAEALVNTVNTVGVMGKGIALMFKERFPANMEAYARACEEKKVTVGKVFVTETGALLGPRWIVNFPTKQHWRSPSKLQWIEDGLKDLREFILENNVSSIAIPPLGAGNGGLEWSEVLPKIESALGDLDEVEIQVYQPTAKYQNVAKRKGVEKLTPARALTAELIRRYWILGNECTLLEVHKLAWFLQRAIQTKGLTSPLKLSFEAKNYGPFAANLNHLLNHLDGSYLKADKRIPDAKRDDIIAFNDARKDEVAHFLMHKSSEYADSLDSATDLIEGFESPYGLELLATVDWLIHEAGVAPSEDSVLNALARWPAGEQWASRKVQLFDREAIRVALGRLVS